MKRIKALPTLGSIVTDEVVRAAVKRGAQRRETMHRFTLRFALPSQDADPADYVKALATSGCTDATIGIDLPGQISLAFARRARSFTEAVKSASVSVTEAIPGTGRVEVVVDG